jgi:hypothetical protein
LQELWIKPRERAHGEHARLDARVERLGGAAREDVRRELDAEAKLGERRA